MKKFIVLILGLALTAASCNLLTGVTGTKGIFLSEDAGESFHASDKLNVGKGDISGIQVNNLVLDPSSPDIVYLASSSGIYKSEDQTKTWKYILSGLNTVDVATDAINPQVVYAGGLSGSNGKIIKSLDGGSSWVDIYTEASKNNAVLSLAISPSNPSTVLAALGNGEIIRSTDAGHTWQAVTELLDRPMKMRFANSNTVYILMSRTGLHKSVDAGLTWTDASAVLTTSGFFSSNSSAVSVSAFYDFALDQRQAGVLYLGTEQGLLRTVNDGTNWALLKLPVRNGALRASAIAVDPSSSNNLYVAVASTIFKTTNGGLSWETKVLPVSPEVHSIIINPNSTNIIYLGIGSNRQ